MRELNIITKIRVCNYEELNLSEKILIDAAKDATSRSYSPYSHFRVGAAVRLSNGEIVAGSNQENVAYPSGLCAERTALFYATSHFSGIAVQEMAIAAFSQNDFTKYPVTPCGACRQVMMEVQSRYKNEIKLYLYGEKEIFIVETITDILPLSFGEENL
ncbi:cytidine deaminase [Bacteroidales bacterium OttesenSCG-928-M06]|nr:cytidine deaminase [Bacteroidales bacterium OttesenSCG-928-M06]